tara:strand:+ start:628 stop:1542 length:915 start_codon:yes stop_codon:yes gene_type:complete
MDHDFRLGDSFDLIKTIESNSIDLCLTDPPYFLDTLGDEWDTDNIDKRKPTKPSNVFKSLPKGMKFDREQGPRFEKFMHDISMEIKRVLKPGGFMISFSSARLYHRMTVGVEDAGFEIRDMIGWTYQGQAKAFSQDHIIQKQKNLTQEEKDNLIRELEGWKTAQLKPCIEPMCLAQKPVEGKIIENYLKYGTGLMNTKNRFQDQFPGNIIPVAKPTKKEKGDFNDHVSVKPVELLEHLIKLFTKQGAMVLDPFLGSGSTLVACENTARRCVGFEISDRYFEIIKKRLKKTTGNGLFGTTSSVTN